MSELNQDSVFYKNIEDNSRICTNCYRKLKTYSDPHYTLTDAATALVEYENHVEHGWFDDKGDTERSSVKRPFCKCGDVDDAKIRPLDNRQIMEIAQRIDSHLKEMGVDFDEDVFYSYIRDSRVGSDIHFNEEKYFEEAVDRSLITNDE